MTPKTGREFREDHGDPTTWTTADFETYEHLTEITDLTRQPTPDEQQLAA
ncbi:hypothetical protein [Streptomyces sp. NPDC003395]